MSCAAAGALEFAEVRNRRRGPVLGAAREVPEMRKLLLASALLLGLSIARPAAAHAGFFFSFSQPGFGIAVGDPFYRPAYYYPPPPVVYAPAPVVYGGYYRPRDCYRPYGWGHGYRYRGHRWR
jgi:hypothetical protein